MPNRKGLPVLPWTLCRNGSANLLSSRARKADASILSPALEDLLPSVVHHLSPRNLKRTATNLMDEWEKSLVAPEARNKETTA